MSRANFIFFISFALLSLCACHQKGSYGKFVTTKTDSLEYFFSGEYSTIEDKPYLRDCATGLSYPISKKSDDYQFMLDSYAKMATTSGEGIYTSIKGYIDESNEMVVDKLHGMDLGYLCNPLTLSRTYCRDTDTLTLFDNYSYQYSYNNDGSKYPKKISGSWAKTYDDMGVLILKNGSEVIPFVIIKGGVNSANNLSLSFKDIEGKNIILMPI
ncbi:MAG: hypothetical protein R3Y50_09955 [Rikenellaceae bacterium]